MFDTEFSLELVEDEVEAFEVWYADTLNFGQNQFTINMDTGSGPEDHLCQMMSIPKRTVQHDQYVGVSFKTRILNRPTNIPDMWANAFSGVPCLWPQNYVPGPEVGLSDERAVLFAATDGVATGRRFLSQRGRNYNLRFTCSAEEFSFFMKWFEKCLLFGRNVFQATFPAIGTNKILRLTDNPSASMSSDYYTITLSTYCKDSG